jgi:hypothetical protein
MFHFPDNFRIVVVVVAAAAAVVVVVVVVVKTVFIKIQFIHYLFCNKVPI